MAPTRRGRLGELQPSYRAPDPAGPGRARGRPISSKRRSPATARPHPQCDVQSGRHRGGPIGSLDTQPPFPRPRVRRLRPAVLADDCAGSAFASAMTKRNKLSSSSPFLSLPLRPSARARNRSWATPRPSRTAKASTGTNLRREEGRNPCKRYRPPVSRSMGEERPQYLAGPGGGHGLGRTRPS